MYIYIYDGQKSQLPGTCMFANRSSATASSRTSAAALRQLALNLAAFRGSGEIRGGMVEIPWPKTIQNLGFQKTILVGGFNLPHSMKWMLCTIPTLWKMMEFVSWEDYSQYMENKKIQTVNQNRVSAKHCFFFSEAHVVFFFGLGFGWDMIPTNQIRKLPGSQVWEFGHSSWLLSADWIHTCCSPLLNWATGAQWARPCDRSNLRPKKWCQSVSQQEMDQFWTMPKAYQAGWWF